MKIGDRFQLMGKGNDRLIGLYILAQTDYLRVALINMNDGNRFIDATKVESLADFTEDEIDIIFAKSNGFINDSFYWRAM